MKYTNKLKGLREAKNLSQAQISRLLNITTRTYQRYESGERLPDVITGIKLATILNTELKEIYKMINIKGIDFKYTDIVEICDNLGWDSMDVLLLDNGNIAYCGDMSEPSFDEDYNVISRLPLRKNYWEDTVYEWTDGGGFEDLVDVKDDFIEEVLIPALED